MSLAPSQTICRFTVAAATPLPELDATLYELSHAPSGARLVWLDRPEENMTFSIAFQTQPWDDTGVFHILEHSVLCGSHRFPVKEPFVELLKSSLNTFLNAMTFPDKTMYPFSTRNQEDFVNLLRVYMDAVLRPLIHRKPEIFRQEGWHYELAPDGGASYKGVVYNEMKGAFASPDSLLGYELNRRLFPSTCYRFESGGHPEHIPELTYEAFAAAHKRLYHPSNSYIFLDGGVDIHRVLGILDEEFLSDCQPLPGPGDIPLQPAVDGGTAQVEFALPAQEELAGRARLCQAFVAGTFRDRESITGWQALTDVLTGDNQAPLKRCLLEKGLARDVSLSVYDGVLQPVLILEARDLHEEQGDQALAVLNSQLARLAEEGLDHRRILATLDNMEFQARQRDYGRMPQGLMLAIQTMESWLYGGEPAANLCVGSLYDRLRERVEAGWFEQLIERDILHNAHRCQVRMRPSHTLGQEDQQREARRLQKSQAEWTPADVERLREEQAQVESWQASPDAPEALAAIPMLRLDQIPQEPEQLPLVQEERAGLPLLRHPLSTGGITYLSLYFAADNLSPEQLTKASFLTELLGSLATEGHELEDLQRELRSLFGQLRFAVEAYGQQGDPARCRTFLCAGCSVLDSKLERALALLCEILAATRLDDSKRVYELLCQRRSALAEQITMSGNAAALGRVLARVSAEGVVQEHTGGVAYLRWLKDLENGFEDRFPALAQELAELAGSLFTRARLTVSVTSPREETAEAAARILAGALPQGAFALPARPAVTPWPPAREGIAIPADVSFAALGGAFPGAGRGQARVMARAATLAYLWNAVRVQGGAYGVSMNVTDGGFAGFSSFRDPSADRTLDCFAATADFLRQAEGLDLTGMMIGAVAQSDPLLTPRMKGRVSDGRYWRQVSWEDLCRTRRELLTTQPQDLTELAAQVERLVQEGSVCVLGSQKHLEACGEKLDSVTEL